MYLIQMIGMHAPGILAGFLGAGVFAAIMSSLDSQSLAIGSMFTHDIIGHYRQEAFSEKQRVWVGRLFVSGVLCITYLISLIATPSIFRLAIWSFTGFSGLFPIVVAALFWRRSTKKWCVCRDYKRYSVMALFLSPQLADTGIYCRGNGDYACYDPDCCFVCHLDNRFSTHETAELTNA